jgi:NhaA family Na+:H+ antiporter
VVIWVFVLKSGVHATLAGVAVALLIPLRVRLGEHGRAAAAAGTCAAWPVAFAVVPVFGFANAGVSFAGLSPSILVRRCRWASRWACWLGKQIGVLGAVPGWRCAAVWRVMPEGASLRSGLWRGAALRHRLHHEPVHRLLAFPVPAAMQDEVKIGVLIGSVLSGLAGLSRAAARARSGKNNNPDNRTALAAKS